LLLYILIFVCDFKFFFEQNSLETILNSTECNLHEFIDDIPQIFATDNLKAVSHKEETNGEKTHTLFDKFSTSSINASKGCTFCKKRFQFNIILHGNVKCTEVNIVVRKLIQHVRYDASACNISHKIHILLLYLCVWLRLYPYKLFSL